MVKSVDPESLNSAEQDGRRLEEGSLERLKELYVEGQMSKSGYYRESERYKQMLDDARARQSAIAPDLKKLEQQLARLDQLIDILRAGGLAEQREAIDALLESAQQKDGTLTKITFRLWARDLVTVQGHQTMV